MIAKVSRPALEDARQNLSVEYRPIEDLKPNLGNARTHSPKQLRQLAESVKAVGFVNPVLIDRNNRIIAGHGRVKAAKRLRMKEVPTIRLEDLNEDQIRLYVIADNRLAELADWDPSILAIELQHLLTLESPDFDVSVSGFEIAEIDLIVETGSRAPAQAEEIPEISDEPPTSVAGDLWLLGKHKVICGNSLDAETYRTLMGNRRAAMVISDPPFNVKIDGHATGKGSIHHREFAMASGEMNEDEFISFLASAMKLFSHYSTAESLNFIFMDWRHQYEVLTAGRQAYDAMLNLCVWAKNAAGMGSLYRSQHELVFVFRNGKGRHRNNVQLGRFGRSRSNLWTYPNVRTQSLQGDEGNLLKFHPTVKPITLIADAILDCTARGGLVLDGFLGAGSTLLAAHRVGRVCHGIEIDPLYVDTAVRRWQNHTGDHAIHAVSGKRFDDIADERVEASHG